MRSKQATHSVSNEPQLREQHERALAKIAQLREQLAAAREQVELVDGQVVSAQRQLADMHRILDHSTALSVADRSGKIVDVNDHFCQLSGYDRTELIGQTHRIVNSGHHPASFWAHTWKTISSGEVWQGEVCNRAKDGSTYWVDVTISPRFDENGEIEAYVSLRFDITDKIESEAKAVAAHEQLQRILDASSHVAIVSTDQAGIIRSFNRGAERLLGYRAEEVVGKQTPAIFHLPAEIQACAEELAERIGAEAQGLDATTYFASHAEYVEREWTLVRNDSSMLTANVIVTALRNATGQVVGFLGVGQDITKRKKTEQELVIARELMAQEQDRFKHAIAGASEGLWDYNLITKDVWYSDQFKQLIGVPPQSARPFKRVFASYVDLLHPDDKDATLNALEAHLQDGTTFHVKHRLRMVTGEFRWFRTRGQVTRNTNGKAIRVSGSITDIQQQHEAEQEASQLAERLDLALRSSDTGLWDWDVESGETYFNDLWYSMLGYEPGELPMNMETWFALSHPDDLATTQATLQEYLDGKTAGYSVEHRLRCQDGTWTWVRSVGEVVERKADGSPKRMVGVQIEIQELREALQTAEAANLAKSEFLANMSHEIRTPMTAILGYSEVLLGEDGLERAPLQRQECLRTIHRNGQHLLAIINDILDMSKIEAGKMTLELVPTRPHHVVKEVVSLIEIRAKNKGLDLSIEWETVCPETIQSDPTRLRQILLNLATNAIKFTEQGRVVFKIAFDQVAGKLRFRVVDTGVGMTAEQLPIIRQFAAFSQADTSTTRKFGGTGLGLRISDSLAKLLGGGIEIESERGKGSTFTLTISTGDTRHTQLLALNRMPDRVPATSASPESSSSTTEVQLPLSGFRILLAEDGEDNRRLITFLLQKAGATIEHVGNGLLAFEQATAAWEAGTPFDVVLMDMQMPVLDGYTATDRLRTWGYKHPIIALTAHAMASDRTKCLTAGCDEFATKPVDRTRLIHLITEVVESSLATT